MVKRCTKCGEEKPLSDFGIHRKMKDGMRTDCRKCNCSRAAQYKRDNRAVVLAKQAAYTGAIRADVLAALGGKCVQCGYSDLRALQIDHVHGDGAEERRGEARNAPRYYRKVMAEVDSGRYQLLCANDNRIKQIVNREFPGG